jgi:hypothetical protein
MLPMLAAPAANAPTPVMKSRLLNPDIAYPSWFVHCLTTRNWLDLSASACALQLTYAK